METHKKESQEEAVEIHAKGFSLPKIGTLALRNSYQLLRLARKIYRTNLSALEIDSSPEFITQFLAVFFMFKGPQRFDSLQRQILTMDEDFICIQKNSIPIQALLIP